MQPIVPIAPKLMPSNSFIYSISKTAIHSSGYSCILFHIYRHIEKDLESSLEVPESVSLSMQPIREHHLRGSGRSSVAFQCCSVVQLNYPNHFAFCWWKHQIQPSRWKIPSWTHLVIQRNIMNISLQLIHITIDISDPPGDGIKSANVS